MSNFKGGIWRHPSGRIYGRLQIRQPDGTYKSIYRRADDEKQAMQHALDMEREFAAAGEQVFDGAKMLFHQVASEYAAEHLIPAEYDEAGHKICGLRSLDVPTRAVGILVNYFGNRLIRSLTASDFEVFRTKLRKTKTQRTNKLLSASYVNRVMEQLRCICYFAHRKGWTLHNPWVGSRGLIVKAHEKQVERVPTQGEFQKLLDACHSQESQGKRGHLYVILHLLASTGLRPSELARVELKDVDFCFKVIRLTTTTTKTLTPRIVGLSNTAYDLLRAWVEFRRIHEGVDKLSPHTILFPGNWRKALGSASREAGVEVNRYTFRHLAAVRMVESGVPMPIAMRIMGHTDPKTFMRYIHVNEDIATAVAAKLDMKVSGAVSITPSAGDGPVVSDAPLEKPGSQPLLFQEPEVFSPQWPSGRLNVWAVSSVGRATGF